MGILRGVKFLAGPGWPPPKGPARHWRIPRARGGGPRWPGGMTGRLVAAPVALLIVGILVVAATGLGSDAPRASR